MDAIVVDGSGQEPLPEYRRELEWLVTADPRLPWRYDPSDGFTDLIPSIHKATDKGPARLIEIVAHGSPTYHYGIGRERVRLFASALQDFLPTDGSATVYLTGCNTGLFLGDYCIADALAHALEGVTVYGAVGWIQGGTAITENAVTSAKHKGWGFEGARDARHPECWRCFSYPPSGRSFGERAPTTASLGPTIAPQILAPAIARALELRLETRLPRLLVGPEFRGVVELEDGPVAYELLLGGSILRDVYTREVFEFPEGRELVESVRQSPS